MVILVIAAHYFIKIIRHNLAFRLIEPLPANCEY